MGRFSALGAGAALGALSAALYLAVLTGSPGALILAYLAQLPLFAAGLWLGVASAAAAAVTASAALLAAAGLLAAASFAGLYAAPVVLLVRQALLARYEPELSPAQVAAPITSRGPISRAAGPAAASAAASATDGTPVSANTRLDLVCVRSLADFSSLSGTNTTLTPKCAAAVSIPASSCLAAIVAMALSA